MIRFLKLCRKERDEVLQFCGFLLENMVGWSVEGALERFEEENFYRNRWLNEDRG